MSVLSFLHRYSNQREKTSETNTFIGHIQAFFKSCGRCLGHLMRAERLKIDQKQNTSLFPKEWNYSFKFFSKMEFGI